MISKFILINLFIDLFHLSNSVVQSLLSIPDQFVT